MVLLQCSEICMIVMNYLMFLQGNVVAYDGGRHKQLEKALLLSDAISDLPPVII